VFVVFADCKAAGPADVKPGDDKLYVRRMRTCMNEGRCYPSRATKLFDFLYIGGEDDATNLQLISELGITHIINCASGYVSAFVSSGRFVAKVCVFFDHHFYLCPNSPCSNKVKVKLG